MCVSDIKCHSQVKFLVLNYYFRQLLGTGPETSDESWDPLPDSEQRGPVTVSETLPRKSWTPSDKTFWMSVCRRSGIPIQINYSTSTCWSKIGKAGPFVKNTFRIMICPKSGTFNSLYILSK